MNKRLILLASLATACAVQSPPNPDDDDARAAPPSPHPDVYLPPVISRDAGLVVDQWVPPPPQPDAAPPPPVCTPNERIAKCVVCNRDGQPEVARDDAECPPIDCGDWDSYTLEDDGVTQTCWKIGHGPQAGVGRCLDVSRCRPGPDPEYCAELPPQETLRNSTACQAITGCAGDLPGAVEDAPRGTPCADGAGVCRDNGTCDEAIFEFCAPFNPAPICSRGVNSAPPIGDYCEIDISDGQNCITACTTRQSQCAAAWLGTDECGYGEATGCFTAGPHLICRCVMFD
ncbi:hypothetical protein KKF91_07785 [Myxococcota bacterium]|nr:hypothetical protein [Myxococcota bacterium]MBU1430444.1 hypothetical protein [Myxococcota bacterium]MBU1896279.1 hypothetical protein [Myxococcota bacterium]